MPDRVLTRDISDLVGQKATIYGWVCGRRDHGKILFFDVRDRSGTVQVVVPSGGQLNQIAEKLKLESTVMVSGEVCRRPEKMINPEIISGNVELKAQTIEVLGPSADKPFDSNIVQVGEELRLKYRYLDLRSNELRQRIARRSSFNKFCRDFMIKHDFIEIETPLLTKSTPEGARDFVVPSRLNPGKFYALPQSPQQYKQLLMVAGFERYFQISRCFRDEDSRGDRQPEFTQLDIELAFTSEQEITQLIERLMIELVNSLYPKKRITLLPFPRLTFDQSKDRYGIDQPDLRKETKNPDELSFVWINDYPMFEWRAQENRLDSVHHPFTAPKDEFLDNFDKQPLKARAKQYDLVCNGLELGGGSIRIHDPQILKRVFRLLGHTPQAIQDQFGHLLEAFEFGAPPHGGIALGIDRIMMLLENQPSIREVIAFPKTGDGRDLLMTSPSKLDPSQLKDLKIKIGSK